MTPGRSEPLISLVSSASVSEPFLFASCILTSLRSEILFRCEYSFMASKRSESGACLISLPEGASLPRSGPGHLEVPSLSVVEPSSDSIEVLAESVSVSSHSSSDDSSSEFLPRSALISVLHVAVSVSMVLPIGFRFGFLRSPMGMSASSMRVNTRRVSSSTRQVSSPNGMDRSRKS